MRIEIFTGGRQKEVVVWGEGVPESVEDPREILGQVGQWPSFEFQLTKGQQEKETQYLCKYISKYSWTTDFSKFETQGEIGWTTHFFFVRQLHQDGWTTQHRFEPASYDVISATTGYTRICAEFSLARSWPAGGSLMALIPSSID